jgi:uncharacterized membrane protein SirB2
MSLRMFHAVFVFLSILLLIGFGTWAMLDYSSGQRTWSLALSLVSYVFGTAMIFYGYWFMKKIRQGSL